jgi:hypothetical protein
MNLPDYVDKFSDDFTVYVTPIYEGKIKNYNTSDVSSGKFTVYGENGRFNWFVYGRRQSIIVEPTKSEYTLKGDGPYTYLVKN